MVEVRRNSTCKEGNEINRVKFVVRNRIDGTMPGSGAGVRGGKVALKSTPRQANLPANHNDFIIREHMAPLSCDNGLRPVC